MKKRTFTAIFLAILLLSSCRANPVDSSSSLPPVESRSEKQVESPKSSSLTISESAPTEGVPSFPNLEDAPEEYFTSGNMDKEIGMIYPMEYKMTPASDRFLEAFQNLGEEEYAELLDKDNFFTIGDAVLFYVNFSPYHGPSKIYIEHKDGTTEEIFYCLRAIEFLRFEPSSNEVTISTYSFARGSAIGSEYHTLNFSYATIHPSRHTRYENSGDTLDIYQDIYYGQNFIYYYKETFTFDALCYEKSPGQHVEIVSFPNSAIGGNYFSQGRILYHELWGKELFSCDLLGNDKKTIYTAKAPIARIKSLGKYGMILFFYGDTPDLLLQTEGPELSFDKYSFYSLVLGVSEEGIYFPNDQERTIILLDWQGEEHAILKDIDSIKMEKMNIVGNHLYFSYLRNEDYTWLHGRVNLDGTGLKYYIETNTLGG